MTDPNAALGSDNEEVRFWRGFIEWWVREREGSVPPRVWEALALAERKANDCEEGPGHRHLA